jgi:hypothetical protein
MKALFQICLITLVMTNFTYASLQFDKEFQSQYTKKIMEQVDCLISSQEIDAITGVNDQVLSFKISLNTALYLQLMDDEGQLQKHCTEGSTQTLNKTISKLGIKDSFKKLSDSIGSIYPEINLSELANKTFICKSNKRLERLMPPGVQYSKKRIFVWKKKKKGSFDGIFYENLPVVTTKEEQNKYLWAFAKELLHNHINMDKEFYERDGDLQRSVRLIKDHLINEKGTIDELIKSNSSIGFPF